MRRPLLLRLAAGETVHAGTCAIRATGQRPDLINGVACAHQCSPFVPCRRGRLARVLARHFSEILADPRCPPALTGTVFAELARSPEPVARVDAARDPSCPPEVLASLSHDWWWEVRAAVAANPACPEELARLLARDESAWVRRALAECPTTSATVLRILGHDADVGVRDAVAEHAGCPPDLLADLGHDPVWEIRRSVAKRDDAPPSTLELLGRDPEHWVRFFVACNPAAPPEIRAALEHDPRPTVRGLARRERGRSRSIVRFLATDSRAAADGRGETAGPTENEELAGIAADPPSDGPAGPTCT